MTLPRWKILPLSMSPCMMIHLSRPTRNIWSIPCRYPYCCPISYPPPLYRTSTNTIMMMMIRITIIHMQQHLLVYEMMPMGYISLVMPIYVDIGHHLFPSNHIFTMIISVMYHSSTFIIYEHSQQQRTRL